MENGNSEFIGKNHHPEPIRGVGPAGYVKPTNDTAFKQMMSDESVAESLINSFFATIQIPSIHILRKGPTDIRLRGKKMYATMDYHAITEDKDHVIIEMQVLRHDDFDKRALFYATSTFANQTFGKSDEWCQQIKNVYAIQFIGYRTKEPGSLRYYEMKDRFSNHVIKGINLIQAELTKMDHIRFPIKQSLEPMEWWYYLMKYADRFTDEEIQCCKSFGIPEGIIKALKHLEFDGWNPKDKEIYKEEVNEMYTYNEVLTECRQDSLTEGLRKGRKEGLLKGRMEGALKGRLEGLINEFLAYNQLSPWSLNNIEKKSMPLNLVREVWAQQKELLGKTGIVICNKSIDGFIGLLNQAGILKV